MKKLITLVLLVSLFSCLLVVMVKTTVLAETSGASPESGTTSRIKAVYTYLNSLGHGSDSAGSWGDWGSMWNRIRSAGEWAPAGDASEADVASGKTFYSDARVQKTGTAPAPIDWSNFSKVIWDDYKNDGSADGDNAGEESAWSNTAGAVDTGVWKDSRTGLYWSANQGDMTNSLTVATCDYFSASPRGSYTGANGDCGNAINYCANLNLAAGGTSSTDWYLPSQKELMQAYLNGIYNQTNTTFATTGYFWSSTETSDSPDYAWNVNLVTGFTSSRDKVTDVSVRCVRRD